MRSGRRRPAATASCAALLFVFLGGCGEESPATYVALQGSVIAGVWECPDGARAKAVLRRWLSATIPDDGPTPATHDDSFLRTLLPGDSTVPDWELVGPAVEVWPEELGDFLRRSARDYLAFGVRGAVSAEYRNPSLNKRAELRVDVYDMGTPERAFGFYSQRRVPGVPLELIGAQASVGAREVYAWEDRYHYYVTIYEYSDDTREALLAFAEHVGEKIRGVTAPPVLVEALWVDGVVPWSHRWFRTSEQARVASRVPGLTVLPLNEGTRGVVAQIALEDGRSAEAFCVVYPDGQAGPAYDALRTALEGPFDVAPIRVGEAGFRAGPRSE